MGTTLTGTTPQDTYDSLIKVTDNGPLSGSLKVLTDGLGNNSALSLSTAAASVTGTLAVTGNATFDTTTLFVDAANDLVGIGTITPASKANILATKTTALTTAADFLTLGLTIDDSTAFNNVGVGGGIAFRGKRNSAGVQTIYAAIDSSKEDAAGDAYVGALRFYTNQNSTGVPLERMRITSTGNVGIGTNAPTGPLEVVLPARTNEDTSAQHAIFGSGTSGNGVRLGFNSANNIGYVTALKPATSWSNLQLEGAAVILAPSATERVRVTSDGLTFNGDTAAANALDDYEEGTWTPVLRGASTAGTYEQGTTYATYTKIGRQVTVNCYVQLAGSITGGGTGYAIITGIPFAKSANQQTSGSVFFSGVDFTGSFVSIIFQAASSSSNLYFSETVDNSGAVDLPISGFSANDVFSFSITYNA